jgi:hypothetical protein
MTLEPQQEAVLQAAAGRLLVPNDQAAAGDWKAEIARGVVKQLEADAAKAARFVAGLDALAQESWVIFGYAFLDLPGGQQDELLARVENENVRTQWGGGAPGEFVAMLVELTEAAARELEGGHGPT